MLKIVLKLLRAKNYTGATIVAYKIYKVNASYSEPKRL